MEGLGSCGVLGVRNFPRGSKGFGKYSHCVVAVTKDLVGEKRNPSLVDQKGEFD